MIPSYVRPFLWSYDIDRLDLLQDKKRIITSVLNLGTSEATKWLFETYSNDDLKDAVANPLSGEWSDKSLNFWSIVLDVKLHSTERKILQ